MRLRDKFFRAVGPGAFSGATLGDWLRVLVDNRFSIDPPFWPRAVFTALTAVPNTLFAPLEQWRYGRAIERTEILPPLFVLGTWRSGTTHLHNLLAVGNRLAFPNMYQVTYPRTFLLTERGNSRIVEWCLPRQRPQDAVKFGVDEPQEEDFAISSMSGQASMLSMAFPRNVEFYNRFMTMAQLSPEELTRWKECYRLFLKKLTYKYDRPLVLKSPANTGRVATLLEMFPEAKFVHIHRNPYDVFRSARHTLRTAGRWWQLQRRDYDDEESLNQELIEQGKILYDGFFAQRSLIPAGRLHNVAFTDLERDPIGEIRRTYAALDLPDFSYIEPRLREYVDSLADYKKNSFAELPDELRQKIYNAWQPCFDEWGYAA